MTQKRGALPPLTESGKQERYVRWLFVIAEARDIVKRRGSIEELIICEHRARDIMRGISPTWVTKFQSRSDYSELVIKAMGPDRALLTLEYIRRTHMPG